MLTYVVTVLEAITIVVKPGEDFETKAMANSTYKDWLNEHPTVLKHSLLDSAKHTVVFSKCSGSNCSTCKTNDKGYNGIKEIS